MTSDSLDPLNAGEARSRFVILHHRVNDPGRSDHWDLMFECGQALITFEIPIDSLHCQGNSDASDTQIVGCRRTDEATIEAKSLDTNALETNGTHNGCFMGRRLADHRLAYLNYEGEISGDRGAVTRVDHGTFEMQEGSLARAIETKVQAVVHLSGENFGGRLTISAKSFTEQTFQFSWRSLSGLVEPR